jgi:hypothetical protein
MQPWKPLSTGLVLVFAACGDGSGVGSSPDSAASAPAPDAAASAPAPDAAASAPAPDAAAAPAPDAAAPAPDAAAPAPDAAAPTPDAEAPTPDAAPDGPVLGPPFEAPAGRWTWIDFPDSTCDDGTPTGIAVRPGDAPGVVIYLNGGGLCWDAQTCIVLRTSTSGPFGRAEFAQMSQAFEGTVLDPTALGNPFRGWTHVFVPYCTGDGHTGDRRAHYDAGANAQPVPFDHTGARNLDVFLSRIAATYPAPAQFALIGPSAGGLGALVNYAHARAYWRGGQGFVWSDGFPLLPGDALPDALQSAWNTAWGLDARLEAVCPGCAADPARVLPALGARFPDDRFALTGTTRDAVLPPWFGLDVEGYTAAFAAARAVYAMAPNVKTFVVDGAQHTLMLRPGDVRQNGLNLTRWLEQMLFGEPAWADVAP